jgi:hypothetical protein
MGEHIPQAAKHRDFLERPFVFLRPIQRLAKALSMTYSWTGTAVQGRCRFIENADCQRSWKLGSGLSRGSCDVSGLVLAAWIIPLAIVIVACTMTLAAIAKLANSGPSHQRRFKTPIMSSSFS